MGKRTSKLSIEQLAQQQRDSDLIGRNSERQAFQQNLLAAQTDYPIFSIHGQAGIGKTFLLTHCLSIAVENGVLAAYTDEDEAKSIEKDSIVAAMAKLARSLNDKGVKLPHFIPNYNTYWQATQEIAADPDAPQGVFDLIGRGMARATLSAVDKTPVGPLVDGAQNLTGLKDEKIEEQAGAWMAYLAKKFRGKRNTVALLKDPVTLLTPHFVQDLNRVATQRPVLICFDTWERTCAHLETWLIGLLKTYGLSADVRLVIAGRHPLGSAWEHYRRVIASYPLTEFSEAETRAYAARQGIADEQRIADILDFSAGVPVLVATLCSAQGGDSGQAADSLVDCYLKWVDDLQRRKVALACAAARRLNQDVVGAVAGGDAEPLFDWLSGMPFVTKRGGYWAYHPRVRQLMQRYGREHSLQTCYAVHESLRAHYGQWLAGKIEAECYRDERWRQWTLEYLYHGLMQEAGEAIGQGLGLFLLALRRYYPLAAEIVATWAQAAAELDGEGQIGEWAQRLTRGFGAIISETFADALPLCASLGQRDDLLDAARSELYFMQALGHGEQNKQVEAIADYGRAIDLNPEDATAFYNRGTTYVKLGQFEQALADYGRAIDLNPEYATAYYNTACAYAVMKDVEPACRWLATAIGMDEKHRQMAAEDPDFDHIRSDPRFQALIEASA